MFAEMKKVVVGDPADKNTNMGPMASQENRDRIEAYIKTGVQEGARLLLGGKRPTTPPLNKGWFIMPAVLADVKQNMRNRPGRNLRPGCCHHGTLQFGRESSRVG